jgi:pyruvate kinase
MNALGLVFSNIHDNNVPELTQDRTMGSIPFLGRYRLIDFALSNLVNSGITKVGLITKSNYQSLMDHVGSGKDWDLARRRGGLHILPPFGLKENMLYNTRLEALRGAKNFLARSDEEYVVMTDCDNVCAINFDKILEVADGIIISRGDLSSEVANELLPIILKKIIRKCNEVGKPVIVGTQILSSMTRNKVPSRAEVADVANLVLDGVDGISLTNVTTIGLYPTKAVKELSKIIKATETHSHELKCCCSKHHNCCNENGGALDEAVAKAVLATSKEVNAKLIVAFSESGATAKRISKLRPNCPIASVSSDSSIRMGLTTTWGIYPVVAAHKTYEIDFISLASEIAVYYGLKEGDTFIITGGNGVGNTNLMKVCKL